MSETTIKVKCVSCKRTRDIDPGEIAADDYPMCDTCYMPMMPVKATVQKRIDRRR